MSAVQVKQGGKPMEGSKSQQAIKANVIHEIN